MNISENVVSGKRLQLLKLTLADAAFILELVNTEGWLRFIGDRNIHTVKHAEDYVINGPFRSYQTHGFGLWKIMLTDTGLPIGLCGLLKRDYLPHPDVGFALLTSFYGNGYAYEAVMAVIHHAFEMLNLTELLAIIQPDNERSIHLVSKAGFIPTGNVTPPGENEALLLFSLTAEKFNSLHQGGK